MVWSSENGCLGGVGGFFLSEVGKEEQPALGCAISFLFNLVFGFFCMHGVGMLFMPNLGAAYEAWCFSFIYDTSRQDNIRLNEQTYTIYIQSLMSPFPNAYPLYAH
jgi:hypothetical protein